MENNRNGKAERFLSMVLRLGLLISLLTIVAGEAFLLYWHGRETIPDHSHFKEMPYNIAKFGLLQLGILLLAATPIARVVSCILLFAFQHDRLYVSIATIVFIILMYSFLGSFLTVIF